eukprot:6551982-Prymnesium_polylepis.1
MVGSTPSPSSWSSTISQTRMCASPPREASSRASERPARRGAARRGEARRGAARRVEGTHAAPEAARRADLYYSIREVGQPY